jgi:2-C-methyl-D-erythritol 4-phosphate cytidylyltransferase
MNVKIIVPVAGKGKRFGGEVPKQFYDLAGQPIIFHTVKKLITSPLISGGVIVCGADDKIQIQDLLNQLPGFAENYKIVIGGEKRQDSVYTGFENLEGDTNFVLIHDGARPFVSHEIIDRCVYGAEKSGACIAAIPLNDTIKIIKNGKIVETVDRNELQRAQTPQVFKYEILQDSFRQSKNGKINFTDEAAMVENSGYEVHVVTGDNKNIKITTQDDLLIAERIAEQGN